MGRKTIIACADELECINGYLCYKGERISMAYNKMRVSTENSQRIGWKRGFQKRYAAFLEAHQRGTFVPVNNLCALTIPEDKSFLEIFHDDDFRKTLSHHERQIIDTHCLWTKKLTAEVCQCPDSDGKVDLLNYVSKNKNKLVIKPSNESRGYKVYIGNETPQHLWDQVIAQHNAVEPLVVQEYVAPCQFPVRNIKDESFVTENMYNTLALAMVDGDFTGFISRISRNAVTNVSKEGFTQPTIIIGSESSVELAG